MYLNWLRGQVPLKVFEKWTFLSHLVRHCLQVDVDGSLRPIIVCDSWSKSLEHFCAIVVINTDLASGQEVAYSILWGVVNKLLNKNLWSILQHFLLDVFQFFETLLRLCDKWKLTMKNLGRGLRPWDLLDLQRIHRLMDRHLRRIFVLARFWKLRDLLQGLVYWGLFFLFLNRFLFYRIFWFLFNLSFYFNFINLKLIFFLIIQAFNFNRLI
jgi:hypothetical protein